MDRQYPICTVEAECQDCYKCVRQCPVKAIKVRDGHAAVIPERCVACGHCVEVCPAQAKRVRDDLGRARHLLSSRRVYVSLAPSWVSEFPELDASQMVASLRMLGIAGVGETALGAQDVSSQLADDLERGVPGLRLSSACPAAVEFVRKYLPGLRDQITPIASPVLVHARRLREHFGDEIAVVFIGPCVAKKLEADRHPDCLQLALTFRDLRRWWQEAGITPVDVAAGPSDHFVLEPAEEGTLYPIAGGMLATLQTAGVGDRVDLLDLTGLHRIDDALAGLDPRTIDRPVFVECLACEGGCVGGPCMSRTRSGLLAELEVRRRAVRPTATGRRPRRVDSSLAVPDVGRPIPQPVESELRAALRRVGKSTVDDELNCGGCGYDSCRQFAAALLAGNAEAAMCVSYMRKIAQKKANALLRCMPSGVVIVDNDLRVIECNRPFAEMFGEDTELAFDAQPGLVGAFLDRILPFCDLFRAALRSSQDIAREHMPVEGRLFNVNIFSIEPRQTVGAIIQDVTDVEFRREQIARRAREVIQKNMQTVQEIACRLGEHMADTEILLNWIASDYAPDDAGSEPVAENNA